MRRGIEARKGAGLVGVAAGRCQINLDRRIFQGKDRTRTQLIDGLRTESEANRILLRLRVLPKFKNDLRVGRGVVDAAIGVPMQAEQAADVAQIRVVCAQIDQARAGRSNGSRNRFAILRLRRLFERPKDVSCLLYTSLGLGGA